MGTINSKKIRFERVEYFFRWLEVLINQFLSKKFLVELYSKVHFLDIKNQLNVKI